MTSRNGTESQFVTLSSESWSEIKKLVHEAADIHSISSAEWNSLVDQVHSDLNESKAHC